MSAFDFPLVATSRCQHHGLAMPKDATRIPYLSICEGFHEVGGLLVNFLSKTS